MEQNYRRVEIIYFKQSGKYYSTGHYQTDKEHLWEIWEEVESMLDTGKRPGLVDGKNEFFAVISVPSHPHDHPHLISPKLTINLNKGTIE